ncbi:MAG: reverse transcriptase domain-containing protein, partial [Myxococcota bacterium]
MSNSRRQQIYDRIRQSSKQEYILDEMVRLGFWDPGQNASDPVREVRRRSAIERELRALTTEQSRLHNVHALVREARKQRLAESRRKRKETKERRLRERHARAQQWRERKKRELLYLGEQVSGGLSQVESDRAALEAAGLPLMARPADMARQMGVSVSELRFLAWNRSVSAISHYKRFTIPKRRGGRRLISAPMPRLKRAQRWILDHVLTPITVHEAAHGFRSGRSIVTNAAPHVGAAVVVNMDLRDFFPTLTFRRVRGAFGALGYSGSVATVLALLCTEPDTEQVQLDGNTWHVALGPRHLPQGAPTSPALTNIICRRLDRRLTGLAQELGFVYTRYADDLTFSKPVLGEQPVIGRLLGQAGHIIEDEGFVVHPDKT